MQPNKENNLEIKRHSLEHVMVLAIRRLYDENILLGVGPVIENGFYQDFDFTFSEEDFPKIEAEMQKIIKEDLAFKREEVKIDVAIEYFEEQGQKYKVELLKDIKSKGSSKMNDEAEVEVVKNLAESGIVSMYSVGIHKDLCRGPHVESTSELKGMAFKLDRIAGAYWRGNEKNKMLTRIYAVAFPSKAEIDKYYELQEEAKRRDHRKLGKELDLFAFSDLVGKGLPLYTEKGAAIRRELERFIVDEEISHGYIHVYTPDIASLDLYRTSGHYPYYKESMYAPITIDEEEYMLRPMTCPHHFALYGTKKRSYKELPMRIAELAQLYRYEQSGELTGLIRVRSFCLADAHIVTPKSLAAQEVESALGLVERVATVLGLKPNEDYWYRLSLGDRNDEKKYFKDDAAWDEAEDVLRGVLSGRSVRNYEAAGEAAFYGPKIDIQMRNVNGKEDTAFTVQYDFTMPKRFSLKYTDEHGQEVEPVVIHRSSIGAIERIIAFLIERYAGAFPTWLAPIQVKLIPIGEGQYEYANDVQAQIKLAFAQVGLTARVEIDSRSETLQARIRDAAAQKVPYTLILGGREAEAAKVAVRVRGAGDKGVMGIKEFTDKLVEEVKARALETLIA